jgi:hypothetical protein
MFLLTWKVAHMVLSYSDSATPSADKCWLEDRRDREVERSPHQTTEGLCLEFRPGKHSSQPGRPAALWTPWGEWCCWGDGGNWGINMKNILLRFHAVPYLGMHGSLTRPVFMLREVGKVILPWPTLLPENQLHDDRETWRTLLERNRQSLEAPQLAPKA